MHQVPKDTRPIHQKANARAGEVSFPRSTSSVELIRLVSGGYRLKKQTLLAYKSLMLMWP